MSRLLALEWDGSQARVAVAQNVRGGVALEQAFTVDWAPGDPGQTFSDPQIGKLLAAALASRRVGRCEVLVAVGRSSLELKRLELPPAPEEEWPELVRFQSQRLFNALGDDWPIDFVPLENDSTGARVLAAAVSPQLVAQIRRVCGEAGLAPARLALRPFAAAAWLQSRRPAAETRLLVEVLGDEVDLTVIGAQTLFPRTARLPPQASEAELATFVAGEVRRTILAAQNQPRRVVVERLVVCGAPGEHAALVAELTSRLKLPVDLFSPFENVVWAPGAAAATPAAAGRFAPLLGLLGEHASGGRRALDFLHPRKKPEPPNRKRRNVLFAGLIAALALAVGGYLWWSYLDLDDEARALQRQLQQLEKNQKSAEAKIKQVAELDAWSGNDIVWLDELRALSQSFPPGDQAIVTSLTVNSRAAGGGVYYLEGGVPSAAAITDLEQRLRNLPRQSQGDGGRPEEIAPGYTWRFKETVIVPPRDVE